MSYYSIYTFDEDKIQWNQYTYSRKKKKDRTRFPKWVTDILLKRLQAKAKKRGLPSVYVVARNSKKGAPSRTPFGDTIGTGNWAVINYWLDGDLDANEDLMLKIALVAADLKEKLYVNSGRRSYADQVRLWAAYKAGRGPIAAFPGTSNHGRGTAADVVKDSGSLENIGDIPNARKFMKKRGLCLPVAGEPWHVESGDKWRA